MVKMNFDKAAKFTGIDEGLLSVIKACNSLLRVNFPLRRDDGSVEVCWPALCLRTRCIAFRSRRVAVHLASG
jgi:hypothetical protein